MTNPFDVFKGREFPKGPELPPEVGPFASISIDQIKSELEAKGTRWDFVEAAMAMWGNKELMANLCRLKTSVAEDPSREQLVNAAGGYVEQFIGNYRAGRNVEPIRAYSSVSFEVVNYLCGKVADALLAT